MAPRTVLIGYGDTGRIAADLVAVDQPETRLVVVDTDPGRLRLITTPTATSVLGDGTDADTLRIANVQDADQVIVAVTDDMAAMRVITAVRQISTTATITTLVREPRLRELAKYLGADQVVVGEQLVGRLLGLSVRRPAQVDLMRHLRVEDLDLVVADRAVHEFEIGRAPSECGPFVLAVIRDGERVWLDDPDGASLRPGDSLVILRTSTRDE